MAEKIMRAGAGSEPFPGDDRTPRGLDGEYSESVVRYDLEAALERAMEHVESIGRPATDLPALA
jgi:hypothetical protein